MRVPTEEQARGEVSLAAQEERLLSYCNMADLEVAEVIRVEGVSGAKPLAARPGGERLLELLAKNKAKHVVALKLDRLSGPPGGRYQTERHLPSFSLTASKPSRPEAAREKTKRPGTVARLSTIHA